MSEPYVGFAAGVHVLQEWIRKKWGRCITCRRAGAFGWPLSQSIAVSAWHSNAVPLMQRHLQTHLHHYNAAVRKACMPNEIFEYADRVQPNDISTTIKSSRAILSSYDLSLCTGNASPQLSFDRHHFFGWRTGVETLAVGNVATRPPSAHQRRALPSNIHI
jgi:hypothetical protein